MAFLDEVFADNPEVAFTLNEPAGTTVLADVSGNGYTAQVVGVAPFVGDGFVTGLNRCVEISGAGAIQMDQLVQASPDFTVEMWIRFLTAPAEWTTETDTIILVSCQGTHQTNPGSGWKLAGAAKDYVDDQGRPHVIPGVIGYSVFTTAQYDGDVIPGFVYQASQDYHIVGVRDSAAEELRFYLNGQFIKAEPMDGGPPRVTDVAPVLFGRPDNPLRANPHLLGSGFFAYRHVMDIGRIQDHYVAGGGVLPGGDGAGAIPADAVVAVGGDEYRFDWSAAPNAGVYQIRVQAIDQTGREADDVDALTVLAPGQDPPTTDDGAAQHLVSATVLDPNRAATVLDLERNVEAIVRRQQIGEADRLTVRMMPGSLWQELSRRQTIRLLYTDGSQEWYRIERVRRQREGGAPVQIDAVALWMDLSQSVAYQTLTDGTKDLAVTISGTDSQAALNRILSPSLAAPPLFEPGTVDVN